MDIGTDGGFLVVALDGVFPVIGSGGVCFEFCFAGVSFGVPSSTVFLAGSGRDAAGPAL